MAKDLNPITGWASGMNAPADDVGQAVVIGPNATASGLLSWSLGQVQQLNVLLNVVASAKHEDVDHDPAEICGAIRHQLQQIEAAISGAMDRLPARVEGEAA